MPLLGAHMSIAGGYYKAADAAGAFGMDTVQIFTKSNAQWAAKPLSDDDIARFTDAVAEHGLRQNCSHASYLINLAAVKEELREKSIAALIVELERADALGLSGVVLHPGAHTTDPRQRGVERVIEAIDEVMTATGDLAVELWLEATAGQGSCLGNDFDELAAMIDGAADASRIGLCIDTCHIFAAGYGLRTDAEYAETVAAMEQSFGSGRIRAFHLNDSKHPIGSRKDRHEHIGEGEIGESAFRRVLTDERFADLPMFLETKKEDRDGEPMDAVNLATLRRLAS